MSGRAETIVQALVAGLGFTPSQVTPTAAKALERAARELETLEELNLDVLRNARKLYLALKPETELLPVSRITFHYPDLERVWRKTEQRRLRDERERLERHALFTDERPRVPVQ